MKEITVSREEIDSLYEKLNFEAESGGYHLNPDIETTKELIEGLIINRKRYGYEACPCRLASGIKESDIDIICPCDYRDPDLSDYNTCYCSLYVSQDVLSGNKQAKPIPERRPSQEEKEKKQHSKEKQQAGNQTGNIKLSSLPYPVWRCKVCGYLCARDGPPATCPVCKATKERFEKFI